MINQRLESNPNAFITEIDRTITNTPAKKLYPIQIRNQLKRADALFSFMDSTRCTKPNAYAPKCNCRSIVGGNTPKQKDKQIDTF